MGGIRIFRGHYRGWDSDLVEVTALGGIRSFPKRPSGLTVQDFREGLEEFLGGVGFVEEDGDAFEGAFAGVHSRS